MDKKNMLDRVLDILEGSNGRLYFALLVLLGLFGLDAFVRGGYSCSANGVEITPGKPESDTETEDVDEAA